MVTNLRFILLSAAALALALVLAPRTADAHGTPDQFLQFGPGCLQSVMKASAPSSGPLRQEFVPSANQLSGVDVCLTTTSNSVVNMSIRSGSAASPGPVLASGSTSQIGAPNIWVHIELASTLNITPGTPLVIELSGFPTFEWRGMCGTAGNNTCTPGDATDLYPAGTSSAAPVVSDFGFVTYVPNDADGDGVLDGQDNCINNANPGQENHDRNFTDLAPYGKGFNDLTLPNSDNFGDACDGDDDNDGLSDFTEGSLPGASCPPATAALNPLVADTDGDFVIDGAECGLGSSPNSAASLPANPAPGTDPDNDKLSTDYENSIASNPNVADSDSDGVSDGNEVKFFGSSPLIANTDGDACADGKEVASINADTQVNVIDLQQVAGAAGPKTGPKYVPDFDMNRSGSIDVIDLLAVAQQVGPCI